MTRLAFVGDVHGDDVALRAVLSQLEDDRHIVFLGDLINRGSHSRMVLDLVATLWERGRATLVKGNHEKLLLEYLSGAPFLSFALAGGISTIRSYVDDVRGDVRKVLRDAIPQRHCQLLRGAVDYVEFANVTAHHEHERADRALAGFLSDDPVTMIVGHYMRKEVECIENVVFVDTACGAGGHLSAILWPERMAITSLRKAPTRLRGMC